MHPDERNMAVALSQLVCKFKPHQFDLENCFNPHFFAYGQLPLYLSYFLIWVFKGFSSFGEINILFEEATIVLRFISALSSLFSAVIVIEILKIITKKEKFFWWLMVIFSPFFIQFSHFGTTESLLTFFYLLLIFFSLLLFEKKMTFKKFIFLSSLVFGLSLATKVSSLIYSFLPIFAIFLTNFWYTRELIPQPRRRYTLTAPRSAHQPADERSPDDGEWSAPSNTAASPPRAHCPCPHTPATSPPAPVSTQAPRPPPRHRHTASAAPPTPRHSLRKSDPVLTCFLLH